MRPVSVPANVFAFVVETSNHVWLGATNNGAVAYAMYRAARDEFWAETVILRENGDVLRRGEG